MSQPEIVGWIVGTLLGVALLLIGIKVGGYLFESWHKPILLDYSRDHAHSSAMFCEDCGKAFVSWRKQDGFDPKTGLANNVYERGCPDSKRPNNYDWPNCGQRTVVNLAPNVHNHDADGGSLACPVCVDVAFGNGVLTQQQARELYAEADAEVARHGFPSLSSFYGMLAGAGSVIPPGTKSAPRKTTPPPPRGKV